MQPDGTLIGSGAAAPGGWLRVAKEGGKHLTWSAEYTGAGRQLNYNDLGYMQRQNIETRAGDRRLADAGAGQAHRRHHQHTGRLGQPQPAPGSISGRATS